MTWVWCQSKGHPPYAKIVKLVSEYDSCRCGQFWYKQAPEATLRLSSEPQNAPQAT